MRIVPKEWSARSDRLANSTITWPEACMVILLTSFTEGRVLAPRTTSTYMSAIKKYLQNQGVDTAFFNDSQYITNTKIGIALWYRVHSNRTAKDAMRLPVTSDMILLFHGATTKGAPTLQQRGLFVAQLTGFTMVARVSEYLYTTRTNHWLRTERVQFTLPNGVVIPAHQAHKYAHLQPVQMKVYIVTKKNDQKGQGHTYLFHLANQSDRYCYVTEMWLWATQARPLPKRPFFEIPSQDWTLKAPQLASHLKRMGQYFGLETCRISTHSLRIGGASTLAAAGMTDNEIMRLGSWRSSAFLTYLRQNLQLFETARSALASRNAMTITDVRHLNTGPQPAPDEGKL